MAEINIQRKKRPLWPWILALLLVVGLIWYVASTNGTADEGVPAGSQTEATGNGQGSQ